MKKIILCLAFSLPLKSFTQESYDQVVPAKLVGDLSFGPPTALYSEMNQYGYQFSAKVEVEVSFCFETKEPILDVYSIEETQTEVIPSLGGIPAILKNYKVNLNTIRTTFPGAAIADICRKTKKWITLPCSDGRDLKTFKSVKNPGGIEMRDLAAISCNFSLNGQKLLSVEAFSGGEISALDLSPVSEP